MSAREISAAESDAMGDLVETTARMAGNLGYHVVVALDATRTFDLTAPGPGTEAPVTDRGAGLMRVTAADLRAEGFAGAVTTDELITVGARAN